MIQQYAIVSMVPDTGEIIDYLYTGTKDTCVQKLQAYLHDGYEVNDLSIVDMVNHRHCSYILEA